MSHRPPLEMMTRRLLQLGMAAFAVGAILVFWTAEATACSPAVPPLEKCQLEDEQQELPECIVLDIETEEEYHHTCRFNTELTSECDQPAELIFYCPEDFEHPCPDSRVLLPGETLDIELLDLGSDFHRAETDEAYDIGLQIDFFNEEEGNDPDDGDENDESNDNGDEANDGEETNDGEEASDGDETDDSGELQSGVTYQIEYEIGEAPSADCGGPFGCTSTSPSEVPTSVVVALMILAALTLFRSGTDKPDTV